MRYFTVTNDYLVAKTKLAEKVKKLFHARDRVILKDGKEREIFIDSLKVIVDALNKEHPRCNPIEIEVYSYQSEKCLNINARGVCSMKIYTENKWKGGLNG